MLKLRRRRAGYQLTEVSMQGTQEQAKDGRAPLAAELPQERAVVQEL